VFVPADQASATVVHELSNALTGIAGWAQLAKGSGPMPARAREAVDVVARATHDALETAQSLFGALRGDRTDDATCDATDTVTTALAVLTPLAMAKRVTLRTALGTDLRARLPGSELRSVVMNLVKNAIEAAPTPGEVVVTLERMGTGVLLAVIDDGPGIPEAIRPTLFRPFHSGKAGGSGLGLALVHDLVLARSGSVEVDSRQGQGTRFVVRLPESVTASCAPLRSGVIRRTAALTSSPPADAQSTADVCAPARVFIVDDDDALREFVATALSVRGYDVEVASTMRDALEHNGPCDLALIDLQLRDAHGAELAKSLRARGIATAIVLMTGGAVRDDDAAGIAAVLQKPFDMPELLDVVQRCIKATALPPAAEVEGPPHAATRR
jgi:CheY-like chemotaxis protein